MPNKREASHRSYQRWSCKPADDGRLTAGVNKNHHSSMATCKSSRAHRHISLYYLWLKYMVTATKVFGRAASSGCPVHKFTTSASFVPAFHVLSSAGKQETGIASRRARRSDSRLCLGMPELDAIGPEEAGGGWPGLPTAKRRQPSAPSSTSASPRSRAPVVIPQAHHRFALL